MADLDDQIRAWADAHAPTEPAIRAADVMAGGQPTSLERPHGAFRGGRRVLVALGIAALVGMAAAAFVLTREDPPDSVRAGQPTPTTDPSVRTPTATAEEGALTVRLDLDDDIVATGSLLEGTVTVDNMGEPFDVTMCGAFFGLVLTGPDLPFMEGRSDCATPLTIPAGRSMYRVSVPVQHLSCSERPGVGRPCTEEAMRLEPGGYEAELTQAEPVLPRPDPIPVRVTGE